MSPQKNADTAISTLQELLSKPKQRPALADDAPAKIRAEYEGDTLLLEEQHTEALAAYRALGSTARRIRSKMAWCQHALKDYGAVERLLFDAEKYGASLEIYLLIVSKESKAEFHSLSGQDRENVIRMLEVALKNPAPVLGIFNLVTRYIHDPQRREEISYVAYERFSHFPEIRRRHVNTVFRLPHTSREDMLSIVRQAVGAKDATLGDLWQAHLVCKFYNLHGEARQYLAKMRERIAHEYHAPIDLADAELLQADNQINEARAAFLQIDSMFSAKEKTEATLTVRIWSARALTRIAIQLGDLAGVRRHAKELVDATLAKDFATATDDEGVLGCSYIHFNLDEEWAMAESDVHLQDMQDPLLSGLDDQDLLCIFRVAFAKDAARTSVENGTEQTAVDRNAIRHAEILRVGAEHLHPSICRDFAWALLEEGKYHEAGSALAEFEFGSHLAAGDDADPYIFDEDLLKENERNVVDIVRLFAEGVLDNFFAQAGVDLERVAKHGYRIFAALVRNALIEHNLHKLFDDFVSCITLASSESDIELTKDELFDAGLAAHYMKRNAEAIGFYRQCLELKSDHEAALSNLNLLLPPEEKERFSARRYIASFSTLEPWIAIDDLTLEQAVYFVALFRACGELEQDRILRPFAESDLPLAPTRDARQPVFSVLNAGLVRISTDSPLNAFDFDQRTGNISGIYTHRIHWEVPPLALKLLREIESLAVAGQLPQAWIRQAPALAMALAREECFSYLEHCAEKRGLHAPQSEKAALMIDNLLQTFSVGQCYGIIWKGAVGASDFSQRTPKATVAHVSNVLIVAAQRYADRARAEGWDLKVFARPTECPRTHLSYVLHDVFLRNGERCFNEPISQLFGRGDESNDGPLVPHDNA